ncbi:MAG: RNA 2',3'-cyclic phosphodiesterase [Halopseudomonas sabulinigri]
MPRLFLGFELPPQQAAALVALAEPIKGLRWQSVEQLHLTLRFFGEVSEQGTADLQSVLRVLSGSRFALQIKGVGYFGSPARPSILWAGVADPAALQALRAELDQLLEGHCAPDPQRFVPHVTLARLGSGAGKLNNFLARHKQLQLPDWRASELCLFSSEAGAEGSRYAVLARYPLGSVGVLDHHL